MRKNLFRKMLLGVCKVECDDRGVLRLLNICSHKGITTWQGKNAGTGFYIYSGDKSQLLQIADKCGVNIGMTEKGGLSNFLRRNKKRISVIAGLAIFAALVYAESLYIWHIDVVGTDSYTEEEVLDMIELEYPCYGRRKKNVELDELRNMLMDNFQEICWASCSLSGTKLTVNLKESVDVFTSSDVAEPSNLAASMDCTIYSIVTSSGTPVVAAGDDVRKGDILISGTVNICNDEGEVVDTRYVAAGGEVYGVAKLAYSDSVQAVHYIKNVRDERTTGVKLEIGSLILTPYNKKLSEENVDVSEETYSLHLGDFYLPFSVSIEKSILYDVETDTYDETEQRELADEHLQIYIRDLQEKGVQILQKNVIISSGQNGVTAAGDVTVKLPVGIPQLISVSELHVGEQTEENR